MIEGQLRHFCENMGQTRKGARKLLRTSVGILHDRCPKRLFHEAILVRNQAEADPLTSRRADNPPLPCKNLRITYPNRNGQGDWLDLPSRMLTSLLRVRGIAKLTIRPNKSMSIQMTFEKKFMVKC